MEKFYNELYKNIEISVQMKKMIQRRKKVESSLRLYKLKFKFKFVVLKAL